MDIDFEYYKIFYFAAKYGNITKAAAVLGSNQPNITRIIKLLESQLNCRLFIREARGIRLTKQGEQLYSHVEIACKHLLEAQEELCAREGCGYGMVEIGATETALYLYLLNMLHDFRQEYPGVKMKIHNHSTPETIKHLINGELDFAVITTPFEVPAGFSALKVMEFEEILTGGPEYAEISDHPLEPEELKQYPWIGLGRETVTYHFYKDFFASRGAELEPDMEIATAGLMLPMLENHLGIGFVPRKLAVPLLEEKKLVQIPLKCRIPKRSIQIISEKGKGKSLAADTFYQFLKSRVGI
ncbi:MAG: LysR family transcriptional regulator [Hungatella sp.]|nr:LysR family transcriptional regulator [Hungatella sp.]